MPVQTMTYQCPHCKKPVEVDLPPEDEMMVCPHPDCHKPFKVEMPTAQPVQGLVLPPGTNGTHAPTEAPVRAPEAIPPEQPEQVLLAMRPLMFRRYPVRCTAYALLIAAGIAGIVYGAVNEALLPVLAGAVLALVVGYRCFAWWLRVRYTAFTVTDRRCLVETGIFNKSTAEIPIEDVEELQVHQGVLQRIFDVGDIIITGKKSNKQKMAIMGLRAPRDLACRLRDLTSK